MGNLSLFFGLLGLCLLAGKTSAAVTAWTEPVIGSISGSAGAATKINENLADATTTGVTLAATGASAYALTTATVNGVTFSINAGTGLLTKVSGTLDFETSETYVIVATGGDGSGSTGTATVTLTLNDLNEDPQFLPVNDVTTVIDGSAAGTAVYTVNGTDHDAGNDGNIAGYTITGGNTNTDFAISSAGAITVASGKTISSATTSYYFLVVEANDAATTSLTGTTTIAIGVVGACSAAASVAISLATIMLVVLSASLN